ncbi:MAG TPA: hypothetical protein VMU33_18995 [Burkholderiaceae bacterium]|nr:hypothetical protein [Burkholderiaceae bacterium]
MKITAVPVALSIAACAAVLAAQGAPAAEDAPGAIAQAESTPGTPNPSAPGNPDGRRHRGPPPEAIAACQGKAAGDACSFTNRRNETRTGTCFAPPAPPASASGTMPQPPLACRPARPAEGKAPG